MTWDPTITPRTIIPARDDCAREFRRWMNDGTGQEVHGLSRSANYRRAPEYAGYDFEAPGAWDYNELTSNTATVLAQGFWIAMQERYLATRRPLSEPMSPEEAADFRHWNRTVAGERRIGGFYLPWFEANENRIIRGRAEAYWSQQDDLDSIRQDLHAFWTWRTAEANEEAYVPEDPDGPLDVRDPRVRHLWVQAAEVAREQGMCGTYDKVAKEVGVPDRATLRRTGELKPKIRILYTIGTHLTHTFEVDSARETYVTVDSKVTGADLRSWINEMSDEEVRSMFRVYDSKVLD